jgi:hypothetical protein
MLSVLQVDMILHEISPRLAIRRRRILGWPSAKVGALATNGLGFFSVAEPLEEMEGDMLPLPPSTRQGRAMIHRFTHRSFHCYQRARRHGFRPWRSEQQPQPYALNKCANQQSRCSYKSLDFMPGQLPRNRAGSASPLRSNQKAFSIIVAPASAAGVTDGPGSPNCPDC